MGLLLGIPSGVTYNQSASTQHTGAVTYLKRIALARVYYSVNDVTKIRQTNLARTVNGASPFSVTKRLAVVPKVYQHTGTLSASRLLALNLTLAIASASTSGLIKSVRKILSIQSSETSSISKTVRIIKSTSEVGTVNYADSVSYSLQSSPSAVHSCTVSLNVTYSSGTGVVAWLRRKFGLGLGL